MLDRALTDSRVDALVLPIWKGRMGVPQTVNLA